MSRPVLLIVCASCVGLIGVALIIALLLGQLTVGEKNLGGPVAIVEGGDPPTYGLLGIQPRSEEAPLVIGHVVTGSGAADAGLRVGDTIIEVRSCQNPDFAALAKVLRTTSPGDTLSLRIMRDEKEKDVEVRLMSFADYVVLRERERNRGERE